MKEPTSEQLNEWQAIWLQYRAKLIPNRISGTVLLKYLQSHYELMETYDEKALAAVVENVMMNEPYAQKLPLGMTPVPRTFFLQHTDSHQLRSQPKEQTVVNPQNNDRSDIFIGIDTVTGFFMVEGSSLLWDELYAFRGLDETDLQNYVCVAMYINSLKRLGFLDQSDS